jgi:hypothetical protein
MGCNKCKRGCKKKCCVYVVGPTGAAGQTGAAGSTGPTGADSTVPGPTGPTGTVDNFFFNVEVRSGPTGPIQTSAIVTNGDSLVFYSDTLGINVQQGSALVGMLSTLQGAYNGGQTIDESTLDTPIQISSTTATPMMALFNNGSLGGAAIIGIDTSIPPLPGQPRFVMSNNSTGGPCHQIFDPATGSPSILFFPQGEISASRSDGTPSAPVLAMNVGNPANAHMLFTGTSAPGGGAPGLFWLQDTDYVFYYQTIAGIDRIVRGIDLAYDGFVTVGTGGMFSTFNAAVAGFGPGKSVMRVAIISNVTETSTTAFGMIDHVEILIRSGVTWELDNVVIIFGGTSGGSCTIRGEGPPQGAGSTASIPTAGDSVFRVNYTAINSYAVGFVGASTAISSMLLNNLVISDVSTLDHNTGPTQTLFVTPNITLDNVIWKLPNLTASGLNMGVADGEFKCNFLTMIGGGASCDQALIITIGNTPGNVAHMEVNNLIIRGEYTAASSPFQLGFQVGGTPRDDIGTIDNVIISNEISGITINYGSNVISNILDRTDINTHRVVFGRLNNLRTEISGAGGILNILNGQVSNVYVRALSFAGTIDGCQFSNCFFFSNVFISAGNEHIFTACRFEAGVSTNRDRTSFIGGYCGAGTTITVILGANTTNIQGTMVDVAVVDGGAGTVNNSVVY